MQLVNREELVMMESKLKTINSVKSANNHLSNFLSATAWSSLEYYSEFLQKVLPDDLSL